MLETLQIKDSTTTKAGTRVTRPKMLRCSMTADLVTYSSIIGACAVGAAWVTALTVFSSIPRQELID